MVAFVIRLVSEYVVETVEDIADQLFEINVAGSGQQHAYGSFVAEPGGQTARSYAAMTYDAASSTAVLFGGVTNYGAPHDDTWTWG